MCADPNMIAEVLASHSGNMEAAAMDLLDFDEPTEAPAKPSADSSREPPTKKQRPDDDKKQDGVRT